MNGDAVDSSILSAQPVSHIPPGLGEGDLGRQEREEIDAMHDALRKIANEVCIVC